MYSIGGDLRREALSAPPELPIGCRIKHLAASNLPETTDFEVFWVWNPTGMVPPMTPVSKIPIARIGLAALGSVFLAVAVGAEPPGTGAPPAPDLESSPETPPISGSRPVGGVSPRTREPAAARAGDAESAAPPAGRFDPSERVPAGSSVSFPVDI